MVSIDPCAVVLGDLLINCWVKYTLRCDDIEQMKSKNSKTLCFLMANIFAFVCLLFSIQGFKILKILILSLTETLIFSHVVDLNETVRCLIHIQTLCCPRGHNPGVTGGKCVMRAHVLAFPA